MIKRQYVKGGGRVIKRQHVRGGGVTGPCDKETTR